MRAGSTISTGIPNSSRKPLRRQNRVVNCVSQSGEASTRIASRRLSETGRDEKPDGDKNKTERRLPRFAAFHQPAAPAHQRFAREDAEQEQRESGANAEGKHGERDLRKIFALGGKHGGGAERGADARAPHRAEKEPEPELAAHASRREIVGIAAGPVADRRGRERKLLLQARHEQHEADPDQENRR